MNVTIYTKTVHVSIVLLRTNLACVSFAFLNSYLMNLHSHLVHFVLIFIKPSSMVTYSLLTPLISHSNNESIIAFQYVNSSFPRLYTVYE